MVTGSSDSLGDASQHFPISPGSEHDDEFSDAPHRDRSTTSDSSVTASDVLKMHYTWMTRSIKPKSIYSIMTYQVVSSNPFRYLVNIIILASAAQMGIAADRRGPEWKDLWRNCDHAFTSIFIVEMLLKLLALGLTYFFDYWNLLDCFVALASIIDVWVLYALFPDQDAVILTLFRLLRLLRVVKMLRVVPELMLVVEGLVRSLQSMFWVFLLLAVILYTVGIYCVEAIGVDSAGYVAFSQTQESIDSIVVDDFNNFMYFGSVARSMVSLFGIILLSEWSPVVRPIWEKQPGIVIVFLCLVILTTFGVLNVIIGVVVERTTSAMNIMREKDMKRKKRDQMHAFNLISALMFDLDTNEDKRISRKEMEAGASNEQFHELLQQVNFPHGFTYGEFHAMLDTDGSGHLSRKEFVNGMMRLVYNDQFQRDCMFQLTMSQIKANQCKLHREMKSYVQKLFTGIKREMGVLRADMASPDGVRTRMKSMSSEDGADGRASLGLKSLFTSADMTQSQEIPIQSGRRDTEDEIDIAELSQNAVYARREAEMSAEGDEADVAGNDGLTALRGSWQPVESQVQLCRICSRRLEIGTSSYVCDSAFLSEDRFVNLCHELREDAMHSLDDKAEWSEGRAKDVQPSSPPRYMRDTTGNRGPPDKGDQCLTGRSPLDDDERFVRMHDTLDDDERFDEDTICVV